MSKVKAVIPKDTKFRLVLSDDTVVPLRPTTLARAKEAHKWFGKGRLQAKNSEGDWVNVR